MLVLSFCLFRLTPQKLLAKHKLVLLEVLCVICPQRELFLVIYRSRTFGFRSLIPFSLTAKIILRFWFTNKYTLYV